MAPELDQRLADPQRSALFSKMKGGLRWKGVSQMSTQITKTIVTVVLAHMLGPEQFGLAAMVIVISALAIPLSDLGLGFALVQKKSISEVDRSTVFWASIGLGALFTLVGIALAPLVGMFYRQPEVTPLFAVMSLVFLVTSFGCTQRSLLARAMDFRSLELRLIIANLVGSALGIALAVAGAGPWAIVGMYLSTSVVSMILLWFLTPWRPHAMFSRASLRDLAGFGGRYVGASTFRTANQNVDNILVGRFLGAVDLGLYTLAYSVILVPVSRIVAPIQQVFSPASLRLQDEPASLAAAWTRGIRLIAAFSIPLMLGVAVTAPEAVQALFGSEWERSVPVVQILALVSLLQFLQALHPSILMASDGMKTYFRYSLFSLIVNSGAFVLGLKWGIVGVAACFAVSSTALALGLTVLAARSIGIRVREPLGSLRGLWQPALLLLVVAEGARQLALTEGIGPWGRLVIVAVVGAAAYLAAAAVTAPDLRSSAWSMLRRARAMRRAVPVPASSEQ